MLHVLALHVMGPQLEFAAQDRVQVVVPEEHVIAPHEVEPEQLISHAIPGGHVIAPHGAELVHARVQTSPTHVPPIEGHADAHVTTPPLAPELEPDDVLDDASTAASDAPPDELELEEDDDDEDDDDDADDDDDDGDEEEAEDGEPPGVPGSASPTASIPHAATTSMARLVSVRGRTRDRIETSSLQTKLAHESGGVAEADRSILSVGGDIAPTRIGRHRP